MNDGLVVEHLTVAYPGPPRRVAVDDVSFALEDGGSLALVGASGSGKTSLLLALAGVIPSTGHVRWHGERIDHLPIHRRGIGVVFQDGQLFPHLSVAKNVGFGLDAKGTSRAERERRVAELLELVGLPGTERRPVTELSGGERQRIALARTLAPAPSVVLLDEPLSSLDADLRRRLGADVRDILDAERCTWILVTHDADEARSMTSSRLTMAGGKLAD